MSGRRGPNKTFSFIQSDVFPVADTITLDGIDASKPHCFVSPQFFDDAAGTIPATPTSGTIGFAVKTVNSQNFEAFPGNNWSTFAPATLSWAANTEKVNAVPNAIAGATHYRIVVTCNET